MCLCSFAWVLTQGSEGVRAYARVGCACELVGGCLFPSVGCQAHAERHNRAWLDLTWPLVAPGGGVLCGTLGPAASPLTPRARGFTFTGPVTPGVSAAARTADKYKMRPEIEAPVV